VGAPRGRRGGGAGRTRPDRPTSLVEYEAKFDERLREANKDWVAFAIEVDGEVIGECDLHHIHQFTRSCELGIAIGRPGSSRRDACGSIRGSGGTFEDELVMSALREDWKQQT
jgi:hypothetical protein